MTPEVKTENQKRREAINELKKAKVAYDEYEACRHQAFGLQVRSAGAKVKLDELIQDAKWKLSAKEFVRLLVSLGLTESDYSDIQRSRYFLQAIEKGEYGIWPKMN